MKKSYLNLTGKIDKKNIEICLNQKTLIMYLPERGYWVEIYQRYCLQS